MWSDDSHVQSQIYVIPSLLNIYFLWKKEHLVLVDVRKSMLMLLLVGRDGNDIHSNLAIKTFLLSIYLVLYQVALLDLIIWSSVHKKWLTGHHFVFSFYRQVSYFCSRKVSSIYLTWILTQLPNLEILHLQDIKVKM